MKYGLSPYGDDEEEEEEEEDWAGEWICEEDWVGGFMLLVACEYLARDGSETYTEGLSQGRGTKSKTHPLKRETPPRR